MCNNVDVVSNFLLAVHEDPKMSLFLCTSEALTDPPDQNDDFMAFQKLHLLLPVPLIVARLGPLPQCF